ncbi:hypothetical protein [Pelagibacterium sp. H642]|uniref:hypothetical protein n=1 Tax=Pelagibacterium sp. H642 TaxID=1881069 RepID=UPI002816744A|nr:hypothetical protein [Pelagibacterium sp. H642]WMT92255.1 hypothetical protein NO934_08365 [Pelagibacterium sp. H642]
MSTDAVAKFPWHLYAMAFVIIVLVATAPLLSVLASSAIAEANGCTLNEARAYPCVVFGMDMGGLLAAMFVMGWFMLATIPGGAVALLVWLVFMVTHYLAYRAERPKPGTNP